MKNGKVTQPYRPSHLFSSTHEAMGEDWQLNSIKLWTNTWTCTTTNLSALPSISNISSSSSSSSTSQDTSPYWCRMDSMKKFQLCHKPTDRSGRSAILARITWSAARHPDNLSTAGDRVRMTDQSVMTWDVAPTSSSSSIISISIFILSSLM